MNWVSWCRHENADHLTAWQSCHEGVLAGTHTTCEQFRCLDCGAWLSLGPANDDVPVSEMLVAAWLSDVYALWKPGKARDEAIALVLDECEGK